MGSSRPHRTDPRAFVRHVVELIATNNYADAWAVLHPAHQRLASRSDYVGCEMRSPIPGRLESVRVVREFEEPAALGLGRFTSSEAVVVRITIASHAQPSVVVEDTVHAVAVGGSWRWVLPAWRAAEYREGRCPGGSARS